MSSRIIANEEYHLNIMNPQKREKMHQDALKKRRDMQRCPICNVYQSLITNAHCVINHGITKKEVEEQYGKIIATGQVYRGRG